MWKSQSIQNNAPDEYTLTRNFEYGGGSFMYGEWSIREIPVWPTNKNVNNKSPPIDSSNINQPTNKALEPMHGLFQFIRKDKQGSKKICQAQCDLLKKMEKIPNVPKFCDINTIHVCLRVNLRDFA